MRSCGKEDSSRDWTLARDCLQAIGTVCPGLLWRRVCCSEPGRLLVLSAFRSETGCARRDLLWCELICRNFCAVGLPARIADWACENDGLHSPAVEHPADSAAPHALASTCDRSIVVAVQHQPDGRSDEAVLHDGGCPARGKSRSGGHHGRSANNRRLYSADVRWDHVRSAELD